MKDYKVETADRKEIQEFIETYHYSGSINGCIADYCFKLTKGGEIVGALFYGRMAMANQWKKYSTTAEKCTELRRLVCIDDTPKNTESYFIGATLRWLRKNTDIETVVSYADEEYGHKGIVYKASNFKYLGFNKGAKVIQYNNRKYHDKAIRTKYKGKLKPFALRLKKALENNEAYYTTTKGKHVYVYNLGR